MPQGTRPHDAAGQAPPTSSPLASWYTQGLSDAIGDRLLMFDNSSAPSLELLRFHPDLADEPGFEIALRDQVQRVATFEHPAFARVRSVQRLEPDGDLALISNYAPGKRLSEILHRARGPAFAAALIRQLAPALVLFQRHHPGVYHGLLGPDRIVISPDAKVTIVEHVVGPAIGALGLPGAHLSSLGIAIPPSTDGAVARLDAAADWYQLGLVAASALVGRPAAPIDLPQLEILLDQLDDVAGPDGTPLSPFIRQWLDRMLQLPGDRVESRTDVPAVLDERSRQEQPGDILRVRPPTPAPQDASSARAPATESEGLTAFASESDAPPTHVTFARQPIVERNVAFGSMASSSAAAPGPTPQRWSPRPAGNGDAGARTTPLSSVAPAPVRATATTGSILDLTSGTETYRPVHTRGRDESLSPFERDVLSGRTPPVDFGPPADPRDQQTAPEPHAVAAVTSRPSSFWLVAALTVLVVAEAGVIAWLASRALPASSPPLVVETTRSGENVLVSTQPAGPVPLKLTFSPALDWVRVATDPAQGGGDGKVVDNRAGTLRISSPIKLRVLQGSRQLGAVPGAEITLPAGRHEIDLVNAGLEYRLQQTIDVEAGQTVSILVAPPAGSVTIEEPAGVEVTIDGRAVGRTPLGPLSLPLGEHQIVFRHPSGGSDQQRVTVKADGPTYVVGKLRF